MKKPFLLCYFILANLFSFSLMAEEGPKEQLKNLAPDWQLTTQNGDVISLSQYKGKPLILHFWATWCPYCKKVQPKLVQLQKQYQNAGVELVGISFNEDEGAKPQDFLNKSGHTFITAIKGEKVAALYGVRGTPTTLFINKKGQVIYASNSSDVNNPNLELAVQQISK